MKKHNPEYYQKKRKMRKKLLGLTEKEKHNLYSKDYYSRHYGKKRKKYLGLTRKEYMKIYNKNYYLEITKNKSE